jgi:hypothetical protein
MSEPWPTNVLPVCQSVRAAMASRGALSQVAHAEPKQARQEVTST